MITQNGFWATKNSSYYVSKPEVRAVIYATKCIKYLTFLDYSALEAAGRSTEAKMNELEKVNEKMSQQYDEEMKEVHEQMTSMGLQLQKLITIIADSDESTKNRLVKQFVNSQIFKPNMKRL